MPGRGLRRGRRGRRRRDGRTPSAELDEIAAAARPPAARAAGAAQGRHRALSRGGAPRADWPDLVAARARPRGGRALAGHRHLVALRLQRRARPPGQRRPGGGLPRRARASPTRPGSTPRCATSPTPPPRCCGPSLRFDLVRCGIASYGLDPAPGVTPPRRSGLRAGDDRARAGSRWSSASRPATGVSYGHTWIADRDTTVGLVPVGYGEGIPRARRQHGAEVWVGGERRPIRGPGLHGPVRRRPRGTTRPPPGDEVVLFGPGDRRRADRPGLGRGAAAPSPTRSSPGSAAGSAAVTSTTPTAGGARREPSAGRLVGAAAGAAGVAAAGARASAVARAAARDRAPRRRRARRRSARCAAAPLTVVADDGVALHAEVDEPDAVRRQPAAADRTTADRRLRPRLRPQPRLLALPARGLPRPGPHGLLRPALATAARPLRRRARHDRPARPGPACASSSSVAPAGPVVLVGHSMGGMTIIALAEQHPELFGDRVVGVGADLHHRRRARPEPHPVPDAARSRIGRQVIERAVRTLEPRPRLVDLARACGPRASPTVVTDRSRSATTSRRLRRVRRRDARRDAVRGGRRVLPGLRDARQVRRRRGARPRADRDHLRHRRQAHLDRPQPQARTRASPARACSSARAPATW